MPGPVTSEAHRRLVPVSKPEEHAKFLKLLKCDEAQGYLFSKPLSVPDVIALLRKEDGKR
jgi:EAL domain-containing protein (putative c-di-GMP-specific phosphodiesterase class I)